MAVKIVSKGHSECRLEGGGLSQRPLSNGTKPLLGAPVVYLLSKWVFRIVCFTLLLLCQNSANEYSQVVRRRRDSCACSDHLLCGRVLSEWK